MTTGAAIPSSSGLPRKRVLVVSYSQTGQLSAVVQQIVAPLVEPRFRPPGIPGDPGLSPDPAGEPSCIEVHHETLRPLKPYPFPWPILRFFDAFPESAHLDPAPLHPLTLRGDEDFDLVVLSYQVWFLAPSQPVVAFLKTPEAKRLLAGKPVVTVVACRNMWMQAQEKMKGLLTRLDARLIDNVVLTDNAPTLATLLTTPRWLLTGRRDAFLGLPPAGIAATDITRCRRFGLALRDALEQSREREGKPLLSGLQAVQADPRLLVSERAGTRSFFLWGKLLRAAGAPGSCFRLPLVVLYIAFLVALIVTVVPLSLLLQSLIRPLIGDYLAARKTYYELPSGSGVERMTVYDR